MTVELPPHPLTHRLERLHAALLGVRDGRVRRTGADAGHPSPADCFALAVVTTAANLHEAGDTQVRFPLQSAAKPFVYALALADRGQGVLSAIGVEPTGDAFDSLAREVATGRPPNAMVNSGAMLATCLVAGATAELRTARIVAGLSAFAGRALTEDRSVVAEEMRIADRNRAIAHLMAADGQLPVPVGEALEVYLRSCAVTVTVGDLAMMGATLANGGVNPLTGRRVVPATVVTTVLAVMATCGMYDGAGSWFVRVGLPAKSGVSGCIVAVKPGQLGIAVLSPPLDPHGNSTRGVLACEQLSDGLGLHEFTPGGSGDEVVLATHDGASARSQTARPDTALALLDAHPDRLRRVEVTGPLTVAAAEELAELLRGADPEGPVPRWAVADLHGVGHVYPPAMALVRRAVADLAGHGVGIVVVDGVRPGPPLLAGPDAPAVVADADTALRMCEDALLAALTRPDADPDAGPS